MPYNPYLKPISKAQLRAIQVLGLTQVSELPRDSYWNAYRTLRGQGYPHSGIPLGMKWGQAKKLLDDELVAYLNRDRQLILKADEKKHLQRIRRYRKREADEGVKE